MPFVITDRCVACRRCIVECPKGAIGCGGEGIVIDRARCVSCGACARVCNVGGVRDEDTPVPRAVPHAPVEKECDLVVLGGGGSGLVAAARCAAVSGKRVIVLEKGVKTGGGAWHAADFKVYGSRWQRERGIPNNLNESVRAAMDLTHWQLSPRLVRNCFEATGNFFDWLCDSFEDAAGEFREGNYIFDGPGGPVIPVYRRMRHGRQGGAGQFVMDRMLALCRRYGAEVLTQHAAYSLECENGRVTGVTARDPGGEVHIRCKACILATGSWIQNQAVLERVSPAFAEMKTYPSPHRSPDYTGDGIGLAGSAGAKVDYDSFCLRLMGPLVMALDGTPYRTLASMQFDPSVIYVNRRAQRWINENTAGRAGFFEPALALLRQPGGVSYTIFDANCVEGAVERVKSGRAKAMGPFGCASFPENWREEMEKAAEAYPLWVKRADTAEELAAVLDLDPGALGETLARYNAQCRAGRDDDFFKDPDELTPLCKAPFYAIVGSMATDGAFGGVPVDEHTRALRADGTAVENLCVAGDFASGRFLNEGGVKVQVLPDLTWAFASGYLAGDCAADYLQDR